MKKRGRPKGITASDDMLALVCFLKDCFRWSDRQIGEILHHHHTTISSWYSKGCQQFEGKKENYLAILLKSGRTPSEVRWDPGVLERSWFGECGGGKRTPTHIRKPDDEYDSDRDW